MGLPPSGLVLIQVGGGRAFFCERGVGEGASQSKVGWGEGVGLRTRATGKAEVFLFVAHGGLTRVGFGVGGVVEAGFGVSSVVIVGFGMNPEAVHFLPTDVKGVGGTLLSPCVT